MIQYPAPFLLSLLSGVDIPDSIHPGESRDVQYLLRDGWRVEIFYDCGDLDYISWFISPDGAVVDFWDWPDSADRDALISWRGNL